MWRGVLLLLAASAAWGQPRAVEVFGQVGYGRANDDEGSVGNGAVCGGALTVPWTARWAIDIEVQHQRTSRSSSPEFSFGTRRTLLAPALQYRRGSQRSYAFVGFGPGAAVEHAWVVFRGQESSSSATGGLALHTRGGFVAALSSRVLVRAEVYAAFRYVAPDMGVKIGLGWRF